MRKGLTNKTELRRNQSWEENILLSLLVSVYQQATELNSYQAYESEKQEYSNEGHCVHPKLSDRSVIKLVDLFTQGNLLGSERYDGVCVLSLGLEARTPQNLGFLEKQQTLQVITFLFTSWQVQ